MIESWKTFASNTTLHGLRYIFGVSSCFRRIFWILCMFTVIFVYFGYFFRVNIIKYMDLPIDTRTSYEFHDDGMPFPAVTICNLNHLDKSKLDLGYEDKRFKEYGLDLPVCNVARNVSGNLTCGQALLCATYEYATSIFGNCTTETRDGLKDALQKSERFDEEQFISRFGNDFQSMLVGPCEFSTSEKCSAKEFAPIITRQGLCHTFNNQVKSGARKKLHLVGEEVGLRIVLDTKGSERTVGGMSSGFHVVIHDPSPIVHVIDGFHVQPGTNVNALVRVIKYERLPKPYKTACCNRDLGEYGNYTRENCIWKCINDAVTKECGCRLMGTPVSKKIPVCAFEAKKCSHTMLDKWTIRNCSCPLPCDELRYYTLTTYSKFPSQTLLRVLKDGFKLNQSETHLANNLVHLRIDFADSTHLVYSQYPSYPEESLFADLGGSMGLLLGGSILTLIEFLDYLCMKIYSHLCSRTQARTINVMEQPHNE